MATFTLPYELRSFAWSNQKAVYSLFLKCVASTLKNFGLNPKNLGAEIGLTMVLHTNNRKLDFHPHIHAVIPGGGVGRRHRQWKRTKGKYLFNSFSLAKVFRARCLAELEKVGFSLPAVAARASKGLSTSTGLRFPPWKCKKNSWPHSAHSACENQFSKVAAESVV